MSDPLRQIGMVRVATISPELRLADVAFNAEQIVASIRQVAGDGVDFAVLPELCLGGYSVGDLVCQRTYLDANLRGLADIAAATSDLPVAFVVGLPIVWRDRLYNAAALLSGGDVLGIVPKSFLPSTGEYYEDRWFTSGADVVGAQWDWNGRAIPFGSDLLFESPFACLGIEICEDLWSILPPSSELAAAGATLILNPSASDEVLGKPAYRRSLVLQQSARCLAAYAYAGAGPGESSTDLVFSGHQLIAENGSLLAEGRDFCFKTKVSIADVDIDRLRLERLRNSSFSAAPTRMYRRIPLHATTPANRKLSRSFSPTPFVPAEEAARADHCREIFTIQSVGLARRLLHTGAKSVTLGISGGLDSALALLVTARAFDRMGLDRQSIQAVCMPGPGTSDRTRHNADHLIAAIGATRFCVPIDDAVRSHLDVIGHDPAALDITFENAQARERTQILMDMANQAGGFVVGTGDLSEAALGWCTFNGDHMSMYHVNIGVPKTLVRYLIMWSAEEEFAEETTRVLADIVDTPVSPELLPSAEDGSIAQETEQILGPYLLHDFFLFHFVRHGFSPAKIWHLACMAFEGVFSPERILEVEDAFFRRFFSQQFKRSAMPDGPKVGSVALSPRGDWRMPSDAVAAVWLAEIEALRRKP